MTSSNGNIFRVTGQLCGEFTGPGEFPTQGQWRGALMFSLICVWINGWVNNREAGDLRRHLGHYDIISMSVVHQLLRYELRFLGWASCYTLPFETPHAPLHPPWNGIMSTKTHETGYRFITGNNLSIQTRTNAIRRDNIIQLTGFGASCIASARRWTTCAGLQIFVISPHLTISNFSMVKLYGHTYYEQHA